jgi:carbon storage regulator CsrA
MLVLTRKYQEKIRIGDNITITVLRTKGKAVRLGIEAPADVPVVRGELTFERAAEPETEPATVSLQEITSTKRRMERAVTASATRWATARDGETKVGLSRVPRNKVAAILPALVPGTAPLRAIMDQTISR